MADKITPTEINEVIKTLSGTRSGVAIFQDCFPATEVKADTDKILQWISTGIPDEYKRVLAGYLKWLDMQRKAFPKVGNWESHIIKEVISEG